MAENSIPSVHSVLEQKAAGLTLTLEIRFGAILPEFRPQPYQMSSCAPLGKFLGPLRFLKLGIISPGAEEMA